MTKRFCDICQREIPKGEPFIQLFADQNLDGQQIRLSKLEICTHCFNAISVSIGKEERKDG